MANKLKITKFKNDNREINISSEVVNPKGILNIEY